MKTVLLKLALGAIAGVAVTTATVATVAVVKKKFPKEAPTLQKNIPQIINEEKREEKEIPPTEPTSETPVKKTSEKISGTYRCWSFNVDGYGGKCSSSDIILKSDGTYSMSSEKGTYQISNDQIILSESEIRGPGTFLEERMQIRFEYTYNGKKYTITYSLRENAVESTSSSSPTAPLDLTIIYPSELDGIDWINVIELRAKTSNKKPSYQAVSYAEDKKTLKAYFKEEKNEVQTGLQYDVYTSSGSEELFAGSINVPKGNSLVKLTLNAPLPSSVSTAPASKKEPTLESEPAVTPQPTQEPVTVPEPTPEPKSTKETPAIQEEKLPYEGIPCDPNIPNYSQPGCINSE